MTKRGSSFIINTDSAESLNYSKNGLEYLATDVSGEGGGGPGAKELILARPNGMTV